MRSFNQNRKESIKVSNVEEFDKAVKAVDSKGNPGKGILAQIRINNLKKLENGTE